MIKKSKGMKIFNVINILIMICVILMTVYPFINIIARSVSSEAFINAGAVNIIPKGLNFDAYWLCVTNPGFGRGYFNTILYTVVTVIVCLVMTVLCAYPLSKRDLPGRGILVKFIMFTMFFGGGMIPQFLLVRALNMYDTLWAIIVPGCISVWNVLIMITFFQGIPETLEEAGQIDGLGIFGTLWYIVVPLSKPIFATMILFMAVGQWNNWFGPLIYFSDNAKYPVTLFLRNILMASQTLTTSSDSINSILSQDQMPAESLKAASIITVTLPILCLYPFAQKYFVKGITLGSVKG